MMNQENKQKDKKYYPEIVTRFAPSPTGYLHIGGARTALFNYLFAKHNNGKFLLRIEDTDKNRSTKEAIDAILESMKWLNLDYDDVITYQSGNLEKHRDIAYELVSKGYAYFCETSSDELNHLRNHALNNKENFIFRSKFRNRSIDENLSILENIRDNKIQYINRYVVRLKIEENIDVVVNDLLQKDVVTNSNYIEDIVLLRADQTPTYILSAVVDDHNMGITHIIRGDDHLVNTSKQQLICNAMDWQVPNMVHISLIHDSEGKKLSKRFGAVGIEYYKNAGYLPEAVENYLLNLGWSYGDHTIINRDDAVKYFTIDGLVKSPARLDEKKLNFINAHYLREKDDNILFSYVVEYFQKNKPEMLRNISKKNLFKAFEHIRPRIVLINDIYDLSKLYINDIIVEYDDDAKDVLIRKCSLNMAHDIENILCELDNVVSDNIKNMFKEYAKSVDMKLKNIMEIVRIMMTGHIDAPGALSMIEIIGKDEALQRVRYAIREFIEPVNREI